MAVAIDVSPRQAFTAIVDALPRKTDDAWDDPALAALGNASRYMDALGSPDPAVRRALADALAAAVPGIVAALERS